MVDKSLERQSFGLSGRALALALLGKYIALAIYGVSAALVEIPTFVIVGSSTFAIVWAASVATFATLAAIGVGRTWRTGRFRLEMYSSAAFVLGFLGYSFALIWRAARRSGVGSRRRRRERGTGS